MICIMRIKTTNAEQTYKLGAMLGQEIAASDIDEALVVALEGDLGAGKTTFVKGLAHGLGIKENVVSSTFILIGSYQSNPKLKTLYHIDPYRLADVSSLAPEIKELLQVPHAVIAIEWAERLKQWLPEQTIWLIFKHKNKNKREIKIIKSTHLVDGRQQGGYREL